MRYETLFSLFDKKALNIDETSFYFKNDPHKIEHFIGYLPQYNLPYWVGYCDIEGGCEFKTAKELFEAPIFDGKSIKERWNEVEIIAIGATHIARCAYWFYYNGIMTFVFVICHISLCHQ